MISWHLSFYTVTDMRPLSGHPSNIYRVSENFSEKPKSWVVVG